MKGGSFFSHLLHFPCIHSRTFVPSLIDKISICAFPVEHAASWEIICVLCSIWRRRTRRKLLRHLSVLRVYGKIPHLQLRAAAPKSNFPPPPPVSRVRWSASPPTKWEPRRKIAPLTIKDALYQPQFGQQICRPASQPAGRNLIWEILAHKMAFLYFC